MISTEEIFRQVNLRISVQNLCTQFGLKKSFIAKKSGIPIDEIYKWISGKALKKQKADDLEAFVKDYLKRNAD